MIHFSTNADVEHWVTRKSASSDRRGMVAAQHHLAARAGAALLDEGGNAVDAAIATALALGAVEPWMCGLGGSGLMVIWLAAEQRAVFIDFQGVLANATDPDHYPIDASLPTTLMGFPTVQDLQNVQGYRSITVPGAAAGFDSALLRFGTRTLREVATPAISLADQGIDSDWFTTLQIALALPLLREDSASQAIYIPQGCPLAPGQRLLIPGLANTLRQFATGGAETFYRGALAGQIVADLQAGGSMINRSDLASYEPVISNADTTRHRDHTLHCGGKSSGGARLMAFLDHLQASAQHYGQPPTAADWLRISAALESAWITHRRQLMRQADNANSSREPAPSVAHNAVDASIHPEAGSCTSHLSTVDADGNMVALTHTLLNRFGSGVTLPGTGLLMNNAVSYFDPRPGYPTTMAPSKRINASNMCPAIATRDNKACLALGASGGNHIMPAVAQLSAFMLEFGQDLEAAMHMPRVDASARGAIRVDPALGEEVIEYLSEHHTVVVEQRTVFPKLFASLSAVARSPTSGLCKGITDPSSPIAHACGPQAWNSSISERIPAGQQPSDTTLNGTDPVSGSIVHA